MADEGGIHLGFYSKALDGDEHPLSLIGVEGKEEISRLFSFDLLLARMGDPLPADKLAALVTDPCVIALGTRKTDVVHGYLAHIEHVSGWSKEVQYYRARLVPVAQLLALGRRSAIYQDTTVADLVSGLLTSYGLAKGSDFDVRVANGAKSPKHEYIVQYQESDWDFIQRWLEHEGFFYWFTHSADGVGLVIADANDDTTPIADPHAISYRERNTLVAGQDTIWDFHVRQTRVQSSVVLVDYNYRRPLDLLIAQKPVDDKSGFGVVFEYGDHYKDANVGAEWAKIRAEELAVDRHVVSGTTDCARFRVGHTFELENHSFAEYDGKYLVVSLEVTAGLPVGMVGGDADPGEPKAYRARFKAIPYAVPYRPKRSTPWPRVKGVMHGHIDADTGGDYAQIDDQGRYKVKLPFDVGAKKGLASSRWIRMAQGYAGSGYGMHLPQHKGTEVLITHIDGDPDRPIIVGAVPNVATPGPVVDKNATQSVIETASSIRIELEDLQG